MERATVSADAGGAGEGVWTCIWFDGPRPPRSEQGKNYQPIRFRNSTMWAVWWRECQS
jgi:hypothetical protein